MTNGLERKVADLERRLNPLLTHSIFVKIGQGGPFAIPKGGFLLEGRHVIGGNPTNKQALMWNDALQRYEPQDLFTGGGDHPAITLAADAAVLLGLSVQEINLNVQVANRVFAGPASGPDADPTFRALVDADIPATIARDSELHDAATASGAHTVSGQDIVAVAASDTLAAHVELATIAETDTGTDTTRAVTPDGLAGSNYGERSIGILVSDPGGDAITVGDGKAYARIPSTMNGWNLVEVAAALSTVSSSGIPTVQIRRSRRATATTRTNADMLSTKLTIDASEFDSEDAAAAAVIDAANDDVNTGDHIYIDIDVAGTGAKGLFVLMTFRLP